jgi:hypothetical protein
MQSADAAAARKLAELIAAGVDVVGRMKFLGEDGPLKELLAKDFATAAGTLEPKVAGSQVTLHVTSPEAIRSLVALAAGIDNRTMAFERSTPGLKEIIVAVHRYAEAHGGHLPAHAIYSKEGKALLSWRVALLPYLGEDNLYKEFKLDEPWDSPHNRKLLDRLPKVYRSPKVRDRRPGLTTYLAPLNKEFAFTGTKEAVRFKDITDGTSRTVLVVDVNDETGVPWTKPADLAVDRNDPWKGLLGHYPGFVLVGLADGNALRVPRTVKRETLWGLFTRAGGENLADLPRR